MDYFAHGFWSYILFHKIKKPVYAVLFGLIPDTFSWAIYLLFNLVTGQIRRGPPELDKIPEWAFTLYGITHSLIVWGVVLLAIYLIMKRIPLFVYAAPIHVLIDIPTHSPLYLPTPFLWPVSDWKFPGISWGTPWFMVLNYTLIIGFMLYIAKKKKS